MGLAVLAAFVAGVCLLQLRAELPPPSALALLAAGALLLVAVAARARGGRAVAAAGSVLAAVAAAVAVGALHAAVQAKLRLADALPFAAEGAPIVVEGIVAALPARLEHGVRFEFEVERVLTPAATVPRRLLLGWYGEPPPLRPAERWRFGVRLKRPHGVQNPGGFDLEAWLLERNLRATGSVRAGRRDPPPQRTEPLVLAPGALVERARFALRERLTPLLDRRRYGGVILALIVGDQRAIGAADWSLFNRTGISHLVSISGLHITMIAGLAGTCAAAVWRRTPALLVRGPAQSVGVFGGLLAALAYALLAGWGIPAQRTVLMLAVVGVAWLARARVGPGTSLALAAAVVCLVDPWAVLAAGFWLSFGAVAAIVWVVQGRVADPGIPAWRRALRTAVRVQAAVTLALMPATVVLFHQLALVSPLANAIAIPVVSWIVTPMALVGGALSVLPGVPDVFADALLAAAHAVFAVLAGALAWAAALPAAAHPVATPPWPVTALALAGIGWLLAPPGWPARRLGAVAALPLLVWPAERPGPGELWVTALDVGQGSAILVETRRRAWLYDTGPRYSSDSDAGERIVVPYLRHRGIDHLDGLVVSHLDRDHSGGTAAVLRAVPVGRVVSSADAADPMFLGRSVERCAAGARWVDGTLRFEVLHPALDDYSRRKSTNALSCVLRVTAGEWRILLTGDIGVAEEAAILARAGAPAADWLAAPHHGSRTSSGAAWIAALGAADAVVQAGYRNRYGHPDAGVVARYTQHGVVVHRTDHAGALQWRFAADGTTRRSAWRTERVRYWHNRPGPRAVPGESDEGSGEERGEERDEDSGESDPPAFVEPFIAG